MQKFFALICLGAVVALAHQGLPVLSGEHLSLPERMFLMVFIMFVGGVLLSVAGVMASGKGKGP